MMLGDIMQRYFCNDCNNNIYTLNSDDSYHIKKVMRMNVGDLIEIVDNKRLFICEIIDEVGLVNALVVSQKDDYNEMDVKVIIAQSLVNEQKMDQILQKGTELGAYAFYPYKARNSVVKDNGKGDKKNVRWQKIVKEASEQSKRNIIPKVYGMVDINELIKIESSLKLICTVNEVTKNIKNVLQEYKKCDTIIIVVGPEGGFTEQEEEIFINNGFIPVSLGKRVLRTETASLVALSMINYERMV